MTKRRAQPQLKVVNDEFDLSLRGSKPLTPRNDTQKEVLRSLHRNDMTVATGPAGTGKSYIQSAWAIEQLVMKRTEQIILSRPTVSVDNEDIGFLPGTLEKKMAPWTDEIFSIFKERVGVDMVKSLVGFEKIKIIPFAFMRGRTFKNSIVILDEFQNTSYAQAKMLVTRIGENTKTLINGDPDQSDLNTNEFNGLDWLTYMIERHNLPVGHIEFDSRHVVRSAMCKAWVEAIEIEETPQAMSPVDYLREIPRSKCFEA